MKKKSYVSPHAEDINIEAIEMLAASLTLNNDKKFDTTTSEGQLSSGRRGEWGNLWKQ